MVFATGQVENRLQSATALIAGTQAEASLPELTCDQARERILELSSEELRQIPKVCLPEDSLVLVEMLISNRLFNKAAILLSGIVIEDEEQLERVERLFRVIREANLAYVAKGEEVQAKLEELLDETITPEELIPTAIQALSLIAEMEEIFPHPSTRDATIIEDLRYTVQLNIDRRRFQALMDAAAARLAVEDYAGAAAVYIYGIDELAVLTGSEAGGEAVGTLITLENGVDIQRRFFEERDYGLLGDQVISSREAVRTIGERFVAVAPDALQRATDLADAFAAGDFADLQEKIDQYLGLLEIVTEFVLNVDSAGLTLTDAESFVSRQAAGDEESRYDWHIRFLRDIVFGREESLDVEGLFVTVDSVREIVETGPVLAARTYGDERYLQAIALLDSVDWPAEATGFRGVEDIAAIVDQTDAILNQASVAYRTYVEILAVSRSLGVTSPVPPATVGELDQSTIRTEWLEYSAAAIETLGGLSSVPEAGLRERVASGSILAASASSLRVIGQRAIDGLETASVRRTTISSLASQRSGLQFVLGSAEEPSPGTLREISGRWAGVQNTASAEPSIDLMSEEAVRYNATLTADRIADMERYELNVVEDVAQIEYNGLSSRVTSLGSRNDDARRQLDGIVETITSVDEKGTSIRDSAGRVVTFQATRRYPDRARATLTPMVGRTSGSRILSTTSGEFQFALNDSKDFVARYEGELPYIVSAQTIRSEIARGRSLVAAIGEVTQPALFQTGRDLLQRALDEIAAAEDLEAQGEERVAVIRELIEEARAANEAENLELAGDSLSQAERLLKSDDQRVVDASDLYTDSLAAWHRPGLEAQWNEIQRDLNDQISRAQADIVITRVQQAVREAQPLVDDQEWADALGVLEEADDLWSNVFPTSVYPPMVRLLRFVETALAKQNERVLREDDPDYDKLAPLLSRATQAVSEGLYDDAEYYLDQFLRAQPNNLEARLLEVDIALESEEGDITTKVTRLVEGSLPEDVLRSDIGTLEPADALEVQSLLIALLDRLGDRSDVSRGILGQLGDEIAILEALLSPPPVVIATPDLRAESNALVARALASGALETLSAAQLATSLGFLEQALGIDPNNSLALEALSRALRLPNAPRRAALDATEQQIFNQARDAFSRGANLDALRLVEQLWADPDNRNDTELNRFRQELLDAIRRGQ